jgi:hypothetical protein
MGSRCPSVFFGARASSAVRGVRHDRRVPRVSSFYGIVIWMYHDEIHHHGRAHFHASYGHDEASIDIEGLVVIAGRIPPRALRLVLEWAGAHRQELRENWERARRHQPLQKIDPLR